jgi:hypothetical protein
MKKSLTLWQEIPLLNILPAAITTAAAPHAGGRIQEHMAATKCFREFY